MVDYELSSFAASFIRVIDRFFDISDEFVLSTNTAWIKVCLDKARNIDLVEVARGSGDAEIDRAALNAIEKSRTEVPILPENAPEKFSLTLGFSGNGPKQVFWEDLDLARKEYAINNVVPAVRKIADSCKLLTAQDRPIRLVMVIGKSGDIEGVSRLENSENNEASERLVRAIKETWQSTAPFGALLPARVHLILMVTVDNVSNEKFPPDFLPSSISVDTRLTHSALRRYREKLGKSKVDAADTMVKAKPDEAESWYKLALAQPLKGNCENRLVYLRQAIELDPNFVRGHGELAVTLGFVAGNSEEPKLYFDELKKEYLTLLEFEPERADAIRENLANLYASVGSYEEAANEYSRIQSRSPRLHWGLAETLEEMGDRKNAVKEYLIGLETWDSEPGFVRENEVEEIVQHIIEVLDTLDQAEYAATYLELAQRLEKLRSN